MRVKKQTLPLPSPLTMPWLLALLLSSLLFTGERFLKLGVMKFEFISSVRSSNSHTDLIVTHPDHPLFQITPVLNTGLSLSEPLQLYKGHKAI